MPTDCLVHQQPHLETLTPAQSEALCKALRQAKAMLFHGVRGLPAPQRGDMRQESARKWLTAVDEQLAYAQRILHGEVE